MTVKSQHENLDLQATSEEDIGLSSAMHDIRTLAASYRAAQSDLQTGPPLELGGVTMDPRLLLSARQAPTSDRWKSAALVLMLLCGLSTSAFALHLFGATEDYSVTPHDVPVRLDLDARVSRPAVIEPTRALPTEPPLYHLPTPIGGVTPRPDVRESHSPPPETLAVRRASTTVRRAVQEPASTCDEVACLLDSSNPCCKQYQDLQERAELPQERSVRPYRPGHQEVMTTMRSIQGRVESCFDAHDYRGVALVKTIISPQGEVQSFELEVGSPAFQGCVAKHVEGLHFQELKQPFQLSFPFTYR